MQPVFIKGVLIVLLSAPMLVCESCVATDSPDKPESLLVKDNKSESNNKIDKVLIDLRNQFADDATIGDDSVRSRFPGLRIVDGYVLIDTVAASDVAKLKGDLGLLGAKNISAYGLIASCFFPLGRLAELADLESMKNARPVYVTTHPPQK